MAAGCGWWAYRRGGPPELVVVQSGLTGCVGCPLTTASHGGGVAADEQLNRYATAGRAGEQHCSRGVRGPASKGLVSERPVGSGRLISVACPVARPRSAPPSSPVWRAPLASQASGPVLLMRSGDWLSHCSCCQLGATALRR